VGEQFLAGVLSRQACPLSREYSRMVKGMALLLTNQMDYAYNLNEVMTDGSK
jgi:hypothetical protein